ncbi:MAG: hypothetical protein M3328_10835 [Chloroflexota bacterium]|nr:hypothetical protein [Chloroflexota bacterium]
MILQSRKWRLLFRMVALLITSLLMLAFAGPASYALQDDTPKPLTSPIQLLDRNNPVSGRFVNAAGVPDFAHAFAIKDGGDTHYWVPLRGYGNLLFVRTDDIKYILPFDYSSANGLWDRAQVHYTGKVTSLSGEPDAEEAIKQLSGQGFRIDKDKALVLVQGEMPSTYRPMVPVMPALAFVWGLALVGLLQILRRRRPLRTERRLVTAPR